MRNLKKFLALVLAVLMITGTMMAVSAADAVTAAAPAAANHEEAIDFLNLIKVYLGDGTGYAAEQLVKRWHMALFVSRATTGFTDDSAWASTENTTPFTDVTTKHYIGAIACAYNAGIIEGVGDNKFAPDANITYQEALTMAVRALGYKNLTYPLGYVQKAQQLGLTNNLKELDNHLTQQITRGQTAEIILNMLDAKMSGKQTQTLAESVFKVNGTNVVVVETSNQALGYRAYAPNEKYLTVEFASGAREKFPVSAFVKDGETADDIFGYQFRIASFDRFDTIASAKKVNAVATAENYGDAKTQIKSVVKKIVNNKPVYEENKVEILGTVYTLGEDLVVYNCYAGEGTSGTYSTISSATTLYKTKFADMVLFDDDNDGELDRAFYTPYAIEKYSEAKTKIWDEATYKNVETVCLAFNYSSQDNLVVDADSNYIPKADLTVIGAESLKKGDVIICKLNIHTKTLEVVELLKPIQTKAVAISGSKYTGTVTSTGANETFECGYYRNAIIDINRYDGNTNPAEGGSVNFVVPKREILNPANYVNLYVAGDRVIMISTGSAFPDTSTKYDKFVAFDRTKDIKTVDASGNVIINAYIDATGAKQEIKVSSLNNIKIGKVFADKYVEKAGTTYVAAAKAEMQLKLTSNIYAAKVNDDGTYSLIPAKGDIAIATKVGADVAFKYGITDIAIATKDVSGVAVKTRFSTNSSTVFMFVGTDGVKVFKGVPKDGWKIKLSNPNVQLYRALNNFIFVVGDCALADIVAADQFVSTTVNTDDKYYMVIKNDEDNKTDLESVANIPGKTGVAKYTYINFYNIATCAYETIALEGNDASAKLDLTVGNVFKKTDDEFVKVGTPGAFGTVYAAPEYTKAIFTSDPGDVDKDETGYAVELDGVRSIFTTIDLTWLKDDGSVATFDATDKEAKAEMIGYTVYYKADAAGNMTGIAVMLPN